MKHTVKDCQVCSNQIETATLPNECGSGPTLSIPSDKILKRINIPEVIHVGVCCGSCQSNPIKGNAYRCLTCKDFVSCETCHESKKHKHTLHYVSSKFRIFIPFERIKFFNYSKILDAKPPPTKLRLILKGEAKNQQGDVAGVYILQKNLVHTYPHWKQKSNKNPIWFDSSWLVGVTSNLDSNRGGIMGPYGELDWPQNISWPYAGNGDAVFVELSNGNFHIQISKTFSGNDCQLVSFLDEDFSDDDQEEPDQNPSSSNSPNQMRQTQSHSRRHKKSDCSLC